MNATLPLPPCNHRLCRWADVTTLRAGLGQILLVEPSTSEELSQCIQTANAIQPKITLVPIGLGANMLGDDNDRPDCWLLRLSPHADFGYINYHEDGTIDAGAAISLKSLFTHCAKHGLGGASTLSGIPATLGGALAMNAGALGKSIGEFVCEISGVDLKTGTRWQWTANHAATSTWGYRQSVVPRGIFITGARLRLSTINSEEEIARIQEEAARRTHVTPKGASAGSIFKNPPSEHSAGWLLDQCGCKELSCGNFRVSPMHANWIVNESRQPSPAADCKWLISVMQQRVEDRFGIHLATETATLTM